MTLFVKAVQLLTRLMDNSKNVEQKVSASTMPQTIIYIEDNDSQRQWILSWTSYAGSVSLGKRSGIKFFNPIHAPFDKH